MKKTIFTILLLVFALSFVKAERYTCKLVLHSSSHFIYKDSNDADYVYPLFEFSYFVETNSNVNGNWGGEFTIKLTNGTFVDNGTTELIVHEGFPIKVKWDDIVGNGVISIEKKDSIFANSDTLSFGTPTSFTYKIASLKGQTPDAFLVDENPLMGNTSPINAGVFGDMIFPGIMVKNFFVSTNLKVDDYEWTLPPGWKTSTNRTGTFTLTADQSKAGISIIPDNFSQGEVKVRAVNELRSAGSEYKIFEINRGFSLTEYPSTIAYGDNTPRTFSVSGFFGVTYEWSAPPGWHINGQGDTLEGLGLYSVTITPTSCSSGKVKVRLKKGGDVTEWYEFPTQITGTPNILVTTSSTPQYQPTIFSLQNININEIQSVSFSNNVWLDSHSGANYTILPLDAGNITVDVSILLNGCDIPIVISKQIMVNQTKVSISGPTNVCPGSTAAFTVNNAPSSYTWGHSNNVNPIPINPGTFTTSYSPGDGWVSINVGNREVTRKNIQIGTGVDIDGPDAIGSATITRYNADPNCSNFGYTWVFYKYNYNTHIGEHPDTCYGKSYVDLVSTYVPFSFDPNPYVLKVMAGNNVVAQKYIQPAYGYSLRVSCIQKPIIIDPFFTTYPNPASDILNIEIDQASIAQNRLMQQSAANVKAKKAPSYNIYLYNEYGSLLRQATTGSDRVEFDVADLPNGIYYLHIYDDMDSEPVMRQIIIQH